MLGIIDPLLLILSNLTSMLALAAERMSLQSSTTCSVIEGVIGRTHFELFHFVRTQPHRTLFTN